MYQLLPIGSTKFYHQMSSGQSRFGSQMVSKGFAGLESVAYIGGKHCEVGMYTYSTEGNGCRHTGYRSARRGDPWGPRQQAFHGKGAP